MSSIPDKKRVMVQLGFGLKPVSQFIHMDHNEGKHALIEIERTLPLADSSVDGMLVGHDVWRLDHTQLSVLLRECRRVLRPGRNIRLNIIEPELDDGALSKELNSRLGDTLEHLFHLTGLLPIGIRTLHDSSLNELQHQDLDAIFSQGFEACKQRPPVYSSEEAPLVSILIPAYNPRFFRKSFESALKQTYTPTEIIISDDSPTEEIQDVVEQVSSEKQSIRYIRNESPLGRYGNYQSCFELAAGEYIKYLNDDDLLHPDCVLRMARCLRRYPEVTLITCHRQIIDDQDNYLTDIPATHRLTADETIIDGITVTNAILSRRLNFVGEPTTTMFRKRDLYPSHPAINSIAGIQIEYINDIAMWLNLLGKGNLVYLEQTLSYFRMHSEQGQAEPHAVERSQTDWNNILTQGQRLGYWHPEWPIQLRMYPLEIRSRWPNQMLPLLDLARDHMVKKQLEEATQILIEASKVVPDDPWISVALGDLSLQRGDITSAEQRYEEAIKRSPEYPPAYKSLGIIAFKQDKFDEAEAMFKRLTQLQPLKMGPLRLLGRLYLKTGRHTEGIKVFQTIVEQQPDDVKSLSALGICYLQTGNPRNAETVFRKVLTFDPANKLAEKNLQLIKDTFHLS